MTFRGFSPEGLDLLGRLPSLDRERFQAEKVAYTGLIAEPAKAFVAALGPRLQDMISPEIEYAAKTNGSIAPINNDLRFNPDAQPYKDHLLFKFWQGPTKKTAATLYVRLSPSDVGFATGAMFDPSRLESVRRAIDVHGASLAQELAAHVAEGAEMPEPDLKRVPTPYAADHPRGELLRRKGLQLRWLRSLPDTVGSESFVDECARELAGASSIHHWLVEHTT